MSHKSWVVGRSAECDIVVAQDQVSSRHCRLTKDGERWLLEDLNSRNGTFVGGVQLSPGQMEPVSRSSHITLGRTIPMPWPAAPTDAALQQGRDGRVITIGRSDKSDYQIDLPMISWNHARIVREDNRLILEDTNSRNGVSVNRIENRVQRAAIQPSDDIFLGSYKISAGDLLRERRTSMGEAAKELVSFSGDELLIGRSQECGQTLNYPMISWKHAKLTRAADGIYVEDLNSRNGTFVNGRRITTRVKVNPGDQIGLGSFRFQLQDGVIVRREYHGNVTIQAEEISVVLKDGRRLVEPTSFTIYPSELVALMGPSGAGKTTLMQALNGYTRPASGKVFFNGSDLYESYDLFRQQMGYVPQDDIVHPQLKVCEALRYSLRLRTDLTDDEIEARVDRVLVDLDMHDKKDLIIGSAESKGLSGGQRKRVNIALELIHDTPVIFLDEPTSGLSSYDAESVVALLKRLSSEGKTIITTIHQPSLAAYKMFDNLIMMGKSREDKDNNRGGSMAFYGPAYPDSIKFFRSSTNANKEMGPEMLLTGLEEKPLPSWMSMHRSSEYWRQFVEERRTKVLANPNPSPSAEPRRAFDLRQWLALTERNITCKWRDKGQIAILAIQAPLFAGLVAAVTHTLFTKAGVPLPGEELAKKLVIMNFLLVVASIWFGCNNAARDIVGEWSVYQRERMVSLKLPSYIFSKLAVLFVIGLAQCLMMLSMMHLILDLKGSFLFQLFVLMLANMTGAAIGLCLSAQAKTTESAIALLPVVLLPVIALGGGLQPTYRLPDPVQWITAVVPSRWAYEANLVDEGMQWNVTDIEQQEKKSKDYAIYLGQKCPTCERPPAPPCPPISDASKNVADLAMPKYYRPKVTENGNTCSAMPALVSTPGRKPFRQTQEFSLSVLFGMFVVLVMSSLAFLKGRDIQ